MPESESFDAFYARTVWSVTSQMHALAGGDSAADHAIREAYAKAYQQWYEVSGFADTQAWVLGVATDAYYRRRPEAAAGGPSDPVSRADPGPSADAALAPGAAGSQQDSNGSWLSTWPGLYRPVAGPATAAAAAAGPAAAAGDGQGEGEGGMQPALSGGQTWSAGTAGPGTAGPGTAGAGTAGPGTGTAGAGTAGRTASADPARPHSQRSRTSLTGLASDWLAAPGSRRTLVAAAAAIVVLVLAGVIYAVAGGHQSAPPAAGTSTPARPAGKPQPHMLAAGRTGQRSAIPWSLVGAGWTLAEVSTAAPNTNGDALGGGTYTTYLVDPKGGKYTITSSSGSSAPQLMAWSGDAHEALFATVSGAGVPAASYSVLHLATGRLIALPLPSDVSAVGFTRPDGYNILAVQQAKATFKLQRYNLQGTFQATIGHLPRKPGQLSWQPEECGSGCGALSSPDGLTAVWGVAGDEMQLLSNAGGLIRKLHVPGSSKPSSCVPLSWWTDYTVLASCSAPTTSSPGATRLWLVPADGAAPTPVAPVTGTPAGTGVLQGAWTAGGTVYVTSTSSAECPNAPTGPGGLGILPASEAGSGTPVSIPTSTGFRNTIVAGVGGRLLVLAQTSCPGTSSLLWFRPATGAAEPLLAEPSGQVGVIAAVPFGSDAATVTPGMY